MNTFKDQQYFKNGTDHLVLVVFFFIDSNILNSQSSQQQVAKI